MKADKSQVARLVRTARGQLDGILRMIDEDRYCLDISTQLMASEAILRRANREVLRAHMKSCVQEAIAEGQGDAKIDELITLLDKLARQT